MKARLYLLSTVSALALAGNAFAADMPVKAPIVAPAAVFSWTGFYVGGHGGVAWLDHSQTITTQSTSCTEAFGTPTKCSVDASGAVFGGQVGFNWQVNQLVFGIEADASWTNLKKTAVYTTFGFPFTLNDKVEWLSSVRGRLGFAIGQTLVYGTGGVAFANFDAGWQRNTAGGRNQLDKTVTGWVAGGGIEHAFTRNWSARAEFLHYGLGKSTNSNNYFGQTYSTVFRHDVSVVRLGINFRP